MNNKRTTIINRPQKAYSSTSTTKSQNGIKQVRKMKRSCCMGASYKN